MKILPVIVLLLTSSLAALAQTKPKAPVPPLAVSAGPALKTYQGEYEGGRATYTYYLGKDGRRVRHGRFEVVKKVPVFVDSRRTVVVPDQEHRTAGSYAHGQRTGPWTTTETRYIGFGGRVADIADRTTTTETYVKGRLDGPCTYADVPWRNGKPGPATTRASARRSTRPEHRTLVIPRRSMFDPSVDDEHPLTEREGMGLDTEKDTVMMVTEFAAGPYRYDADPDLSDPNHRPQTLRGRFDAQGFCDSVWTLRYWKGRSEGETNMYGRVFTEMERTGGWMATTLEFDHGALRRERTVQASTGKVISTFATLPTHDQDSTSRLQLLGQAVHYHNWANPANHPDEPDWRSPIADDEDASGSFFAEATRPLEAPLLLNLNYDLVPTAADTTLLLRAETVLNQARVQFPDSVLNLDRKQLPKIFGPHPSVALLRAELYRLVATKYADESAAMTTDNLRGFLLEGNDDLDRRDNPRPWLADLTGPDHSPEADVLAQMQRKYLTHLSSIRLRTGQLQARLAAAVVPAAVSKP